MTLVHVSFLTNADRGAMIDRSPDNTLSESEALETSKQRIAEEWGLPTQGHTHLKLRLGNTKKYGESHGELVSTRIWCDPHLLFEEECCTVLMVAGSLLTLDL